MRKEYIAIEYDVNGEKEIFGYCQNRNELLRAIDNALENGIIEFSVKRKTVEWKYQLDECTQPNKQNQP